MKFRKKVINTVFVEGGKYGITSTTYQLSCGHRVIDAGFHRKNEAKKCKSKFCGQCERKAVLS